jgi:sulfate adenylyltransferase
MLNLNFDQYLEVENLATEVFSPLSGFMNEDDFHSCVEKLRLTNGAVFSIPVVLDISSEERDQIKGMKEVPLIHNGERIGSLFPTSVFKMDCEKVVKSVFGTDDQKHPGVKYYFSMKEHLVGGKVELLKKIAKPNSKHELTPAEARAAFKARGWKRIVGFQTRNAPHRAHEHLQKTALEICDGILIHPLIGKKKAGDFSPAAVIAGYEALIEHYYPQNRAMLATLSTVMRYAGPREAVFHAMIRRNFGCTHFIVGRDHAGVGGFYDKYAGHRLIRSFDDLGIEVLCLRGPYFCSKCDSIATDQTCPHGDAHPEYTAEISGTKIRGYLSREMEVDTKLIRPEVVEALRKLKEPTFVQ